MAPTMAPLVNSLADERVRGRADSLTGIANSLALIVSPAIVTGLISILPGPAGPLPAILISGYRGGAD